MRILLLLISIMCFSFQAFAQNNSGTDSIDNIILKVPSTWKITKQASFTELVFTDPKIKSFCQLVIYKAQPSSTDKQKDFEKEWKEIVEKTFTVVTIVNPQKLKDKKGNSFLRHGAKGIGSDGKKYFVQLNMYDCGSAIQNVVAVSATKEQLAKYDSLWQAVVVQVKRQTVDMKPTDPIVTTNSGNNEIGGKWAKSSSGPPQYQNGKLVNLVNSGYHKCQYEFKADGTYSFHGESQFSSNDFAITDEKGSYLIQGDKLILTPSSGSIRKLDANGKEKKIENLSLAKRNYKWHKHYFEGINETNLVLSAVEENILDGGYASNSQFPNSFLYSREFVPEWRFPIK